MDTAMKMLKCASYTLVMHAFPVIMDLMLTGAIINVCLIDIFNDINLEVILFLFLFYLYIRRIICLNILCLN